MNNLHKINNFVLPLWAQQMISLWIRDRGIDTFTYNTSDNTLRIGSGRYSMFRSVEGWKSLGWHLYGSIDINLHNAKITIL